MGTSAVGLVDLPLKALVKELTRVAQVTVVLHEAEGYQPNNPKYIGPVCSFDNEIMIDTTLLNGERSYGLHLINTERAEPHGPASQSLYLMGEEMDTLAEAVASGIMLIVETRLNNRFAREDAIFST
jgi:hypothetical protein